MRQLGILFVATLTALVLVQPASALRTQTATASSWNVTQIHTVYYELTTCSSTQAIRFDSMWVRYERTVRNRNVPFAHLRAIQRGTKCNGSIDERKWNGNRNPVWGCGGRCSIDKTEEQGVVWSWPRFLNNGDYPYVWHATSINGKVTRPSDGATLGYICTKVQWIGSYACTTSG